MTGWRDFDYPTEPYAGAWDIPTVEAPSEVRSDGPPGSLIRCGCGCGCGNTVRRPESRRYPRCTDCLIGACG